MIAGIGIEMIELGLFEAEPNASLFLSAETEYCLSRPRPAQHFAARLAAKKALLAALGIADLPPRCREVEVRRDPASGRPSLVLHGETLRVAVRANLSAMHVTLTHTDSYAAACVVLDRR